MKTSRFLSFAACLVLMLFSLSLRAQTAAEPTVHQIYEAASRGDLPGARAMVDEVLRSHPQSARAHYVKAEIAARQRDTATARSELQAAEKLAPGLPFARPEAVSALRSQLDAPAGARAGAAPPARQQPDPRRMGAPPDAGGRGFPLGGLILVVVIVGGVFLLLRRRRAAQYAPPPASPYARDDAFGRDPYAPGYPPQGGPGMYPSGGYPGGAYPGGAYPGGPAQGGLGSSIGRGVATGLAVGAGAVVAQEIGRRMFEHGQQGAVPDGQNHAGLAGLAGLAGNADHADNTHSPLARDAGLGSLDGGSGAPDLGGQDFGIAGDAGWDDAPGFDDAGGGGDWDR